MSPAVFVTGFSAFLRLKRAFVHARADANMTEPPLMAIAPLPETSQEAVEQSAIQYAGSLFDLYQNGGAPPPDWVAALYPEGQRTLREVLTHAPRSAIEAAVVGASARWDDYAKRNPYGFTAAESYILHVDADGKGAKRRRWMRLGKTLADVAFDVVAAHPQVLGLDSRTRSVIAVLSKHMSALIGDDDDINESDEENFGERAFRVFLEAALATALERPDILAEEPHFQALATGILRPLHDEVKDNPARRWIALDQLRDVLRGPVAHGALMAVRAHQDAFLNGAFGDNKVLGAVTRHVLGQVASIHPDTLDARRVFTPQAALLVYRAALQIAQSRPELFIEGGSDPAARSRNFLRGVAKLLAEAPFPYRAEAGVAPQIAVVAMNVAEAYVSKRIALGAGDSDWSKTGAAASQSIIKGVFEGLKTGLTSGGATEAVFAQVFGRRMAVDVLQTIAVHVAERPAMLVESDGSHEAQALAAAFARLVAEDKSGLLRAQDWRALLAKLLDVVVANPGMLIANKAERDPASFIAVRFTARLLSHASTELARPAADGRPRLMGARLAEMMAATFAAAAANVIGVLSDPDRHVAAFENFLTRLSDLAGGPDLSLRMSAADLQHVYQWFVALVFEQGTDAGIEDDDIRAVIRGARREVDALRPARAAAARAAAPLPAAAELDDPPEPFGSESEAVDPAAIMAELDDRPEPKTSDQSTGPAPGGAPLTEDPAR